MKHGKKNSHAGSAMIPRTQHTDVAIIGAGIVGLATAWELTKRFPGVRISILEKESEVAAHQTGHNSGVLHSGIYYRPGSLRATNCRAGKLAMEAFCEEQGIPFDRCGKVIVATNEVEKERLSGILSRGHANGVECELISRERLLELEPHVAGVSAIHVPEAGIVDYKQVANCLSERLTERGHRIMLNAEVTSVDRRSDLITLAGANFEVQCQQLITCGGLWADRVIAMSGARPEAPIVPFRGEFFKLKPEVEHLCRGLIYPVPDPAFPFLGVHFTKMIHGGVECGPNAVFAFARDGYERTKFNFKDMIAAVSEPGFRSIAMKHWRTGLGEMWRSWNKGAFVQALQKLIPAIRANDLNEAPAGVRAQAIGPDGKLLDDFVILQSDRMIHINNAPSPAATAAFNIGRMIVDRLELPNLFISGYEAGHR